MRKFAKNTAAPRILHNRLIRAAGRLHRFEARQEAARAWFERRYEWANCVAPFAPIRREGGWPSHKSWAWRALSEGGYRRLEMLERKLERALEALHRAFLF